MGLNILFRIQKKSIQVQLEMLFLFNRIEN